MIKKINIEEIKKREEFLSGKLLTRKEVEFVSSIFCVKSINSSCFIASPSFN